MPRWFPCSVLSSNAATRLVTRGHLDNSIYSTTMGLQYAPRPITRESFKMTILFDVFIFIFIYTYKREKGRMKGGRRIKNYRPNLLEQRFYDDVRPTWIISGLFDIWFIETLFIFALMRIGYWTFPASVANACHWQPNPPAVHVWKKRGPINTVRFVCANSNFYQHWPCSVQSKGNFRRAR